MKSLITTLLFVVTTSTFAGTAMKLEGNCSGALKDGSPVSFTYYSNFDGCREKSTAAVSFSAGNNQGLNTGKRSFEAGRDIYRFNVVENGKEKQAVRISFADSTGNTSGKLTYLDQNNSRKTVVVQCEIRDYEYSECGN